MVWPATIKYVPVKPPKTRMAVKMAGSVATAVPHEQAQRKKMARL